MHQCPRLDILFMFHAQNVTAFCQLASEDNGSDPLLTDGVVITLSCQLLSAGLTGS